MTPVEYISGFITHTRLNPH